MTGNQAVDSLIGRVFKGYKVTRFIARGGMGLVFQLEFFNNIHQRFSHPLAKGAVSKVEQSLFFLFYILRYYMYKLVGDINVVINHLQKIFFWYLHDLRIFKDGGVVIIIFIFYQGRISKKIAGAEQVGYILFSILVCFVGFYFSTYQVK